MKRTLWTIGAGVVSLALAAAAHAQPANDACANAIPITNGSVTNFDMIDSTRDGVSTCSNFSVARDIWYSYTSTEAELVTLSLCGSPTVTKGLSIFTSCGGTQLGCNRSTSSCGAGQPVLSVETTGAGTYLVCVTILSSSGAQTGTLTLTAISTDPPANDICSGATAVVDGDNAISTHYATQDTTIPCENPFYGSGIDVWYTYTAPATGIRNFEITSFNTPSQLTYLSLYDACSGNLLACDDNGGQGFLSKIYHYPVVAGTSYIIRVGSTFSSGGGTPNGNGVLRISSPPSPMPLDDCALATPLMGEGLFSFNTAGLTDSDILPWDCNSSYKDGWIAWTPSVSGRAVINACGATGSSSLRLSIYDACGEVPLLCNSYFLDTPNPFCSPKIAYNVTAGQTYYVRFGVSSSSSTASGDIQFEVRAPVTTYMPPAGAAVEPGSCSTLPADDSNGGCAVDPTTFTPLHLCDTYAGTASSRLLPVLAYFNTGFLNEEGIAEPQQLSVDSDWYEFTLETDQAVTITGQSEFPPTAGIAFSCPALHIATSTFSSPSTAGVYSLNMTTSVLVAGTYYYHISPQQGGEGNSSSSCGNGDRYWFHIEGSAPCPAPCAADFNHVNGVTVQDIFDFLTAWLAGNSSADFNGVNGVTVQDIFDFLTAWLAGC